MNTPRDPDFRALFESAPGLYLALSPDLTIVAVSDAYLKATMTRREAILGRGLFDVFPDNPDDPAATGTRNLRDSLARVLATRAPDSMAVQKYDIRRPESEGGGFEERHWSPKNLPVLGPDGAIRYIIHRVEDVTDFVRLRRQGSEMEAEIFKRAQEIQETNRRLRDANAELQRLYAKTQEFEALKSQALFLSFMDNSPVLAHLKDEQGRYVYLNAPARAAFPGLREGVTDDEVFPPEIASRIRGMDRSTFETGRPQEIQEQLPHAGGVRDFFSIRFLFRDGSGRRFAACVSVDVSSQKSLESQLRQAQKMEAVGQLAGGIAHDFNNMLTAILGYTNLLLERGGEGGPARADLEEIRKAAQRATDLTHQLLAFSRKQVLQPRVLNLNSVVAGLEPMLRRLIVENIRLQTVLSPTLASVKADPSQVEQVILNLVVNARDAMPRGGRLMIETANVELDDQYAKGRLGVVPGPHVMLAVSDTGVGMDAETRSHLFEPFFTTKEQGKGTGMGLSMVYGIVRQSGGTIWVYSEPGRGTAFKIYLPRVAESAPALAAEPAPRPPGGHETILLVEDEEAVRVLTRRVLEMGGYTVAEAASGEDALSLAAGREGTIDLLLTDVIMPGIGGRELAERIAKSRSGIKILFMSGYTDDAVVHHGILSRERAFLQKPFTPDGLLRKVREVLSLP